MVLKAVALGVTGVFLAGWITLDTAATALTARSPQAALGIVPHDAGAVTAAIDGQVIAGAGKAPVTSDQVAELRDALRARPMMPVALRLLASYDEAHNQEPGARLAMRLADRLSRRDIFTQLWLIEDAVRGNQVPAALAHYDVALRTSRAADALLHPVLSAAISDAEIRQALLAYRNAAWMPAFATYAASNAEPRAAASLILASPSLSADETFAPVRGGVLSRLTAGGDIDGADRFVRALPKVDRAALQDLRFSARTTAEGLNPLTWQLMQSNDMQAVAGDGGKLELNILGDGNNIAARRFIWLGAGRHSLAPASGRTSSGPAKGLRWAWACYSATVTGGAPFAQSGGKQPIDAETLPDGCAVVQLSLMVSGSGQNGDLTVDPPRIDKI